MKHFLNPITNINLKLIQGFVLVGQQKSFKRAAELSGFTQSAMSAQIRTLEEQLGIPLFNRTTRNVELTEEGAHLFRSARLKSGPLLGPLLLATPSLRPYEDAIFGVV